jgi:nucleotide-binding universal stress UspA family protein
MFERILVPLDGSQEAHKALEYAIEIAKLFNSEIEILHVIPFVNQYVDFMPYPSPGFNDIFSVPGWVNDYLTKLEENNRKMLEEALFSAIELAPDLIISTKILKGKPGLTIVNEAFNEKFDLIVMGSRGLGMLHDMLLGSVSNYVVNNVKKPVLITK